MNYLQVCLADGTWGGIVLDNMTFLKFANPAMFLYFLDCTNIEIVRVQDEKKPDRGSTPYVWFVFEKEYLRIKKFFEQLADENSDEVKVQYEGTFPDRDPNRSPPAGEAGEPGRTANIPYQPGLPFSVNPKPDREGYSNDGGD